MTHTKWSTGADPSCWNYEKSCLGNVSIPNIVPPFGFTNAQTFLNILKALQLRIRKILWSKNIRNLKECIFKNPETKLEYSNVRGRHKFLKSIYSLSGVLPNKHLLNEFSRVSYIRDTLWSSLRDLCNQSTSLSAHNKFILIWLFTVGIKNPVFLWLIFKHGPPNLRSVQLCNFKRSWSLFVWQGSKVFHNLLHTVIVAAQLSEGRASGSSPPFPVNGQ